MNETPAKAKTGSPKPLAITVAGLVLLAALGLRLQQAWVSRKPVLADLTVRGVTFQVEIADTDAKKEKGLGKRDRLSDGHGMYFPFGNQQHWVFWMKDMRFPIDIIWIRDGKVVDIDADVPVSDHQPLETYSPVEPADAVLEVNAGVAAVIGLVPGDAVFIGPPGSKPPQAAAGESAPPEGSVATDASGSYVDENGEAGAYANRRLGVAFSYPHAWGDASAHDDFLPTLDTGKAVAVTFSNRSDVHLSLFSSDFSKGIEEGWPTRFRVSGSVRTLEDAQAEIYKDIVLFATKPYGYTFAFNGTYGLTYLNRVFLAPRALTGTLTDAQISIDAPETFRKDAESPPFTTAEAAALLTTDAAKADETAIDALLRSLRSLP